MFVEVYQVDEGTDDLSGPPIFTQFFFIVHFPIVEDSCAQEQHNFPSSSFSVYCFSQKIMPPPNVLPTLWHALFPLLVLTLILLLLAACAKKHVLGIDGLLRSLILRSTAFVYFVAFLNAWWQFDGLWGESGILPVGPWLRQRAKSLGESRRQEQVEGAGNKNRSPGFFDVDGFLDSAIINTAPWIVSTAASAAATAETVEAALETIVDNFVGSEILGELGQKQLAFLRRLGSTKPKKIIAVGRRLVHRIKQLPTLLWFQFAGRELQTRTTPDFDLEEALSAALKFHLVVGMVLSAIVVLFSSNAVLLLALWLLKLSLVNVGQRFMGYGWHPQFLELGFYCIFLGDWAPFSLKRKILSRVAIVFFSRKREKSISISNAGGDEEDHAKRPQPDDESDESRVQNRALPSMTVSRIDALLRACPTYCIFLLLRVLLFRTMVEPGAGKLVGGDESWRDLSAMHWHYWTQPSVNALSYYLHALPRSVLSAFTAGNHLIECGLPFLIWMPELALVLRVVLGPLFFLLRAGSGRVLDSKQDCAPDNLDRWWSSLCWGAKASSTARWLRILAGLGIMAFQTVLLLGGNYSYLSYLTLFQAFVCFDDRFLGQLLGRPTVVSSDTSSPPSDTHTTSTKAKNYTAILLHLPRRLLAAALYLPLTAYFLSLAYHPLQSVFFGQRASDMSFNNWHLVNGYGAFSHMTKDRREVLITLELETAGAVGKKLSLPLSFVSKPGPDLARAPTSIAPFDWFIDWSLWFVWQGTKWQLYRTTTHLHTGHGYEWRCGLCHCVPC